MEERTLEGRVDLYNGVIVNAQSLPESDEQFKAILSASLARWTEEGRRGLWLSVPIAKASFIPIATEFGFVFHSVENTDHLMLTKWLPKDEPNLLPDSASHTIGAGGFVFNEAKKEVLVIAEKYAEKPLSWKLPGGYVKAGESLHEAVVREVKEETGVDAEFEGILNFRQMHPHLFGKSDMYFVCLLKPVSFETTPEATEISEVRWMPIQDYVNDPNVHTFNKKVAEAFLHAIEKGDKRTLQLTDFQLADEWVKKKTFVSIYAAAGLK